MKRTLVMLLMAALLGLVVPASPVVAAADPTFVTYNVRNCCESNDRLTTTRTWESRKARVANTLVEAEGELYALQEATPFNSRTGRVGEPDVFPAEYLVKKLQALRPSRGYELATTKNTARPIIYASKTFTRVGDAKFIAYDKKNVGTMVSFTHIDSKKRFVVADVHLAKEKGGNAGPNHVSSESLRREQLRAVVEAVRPVANASASQRAVYLGDLNTYPGRKLTGTNAASLSDAPGKMMKSAAIPEAEFTAPAANRGRPYASFNNWSPPAIGAKTLDRVFARALPVTRWRVVTEAKAGASDHFPVKVQLRF